MTKRAASAAPGLPDPAAIGALADELTLKEAAEAAKCSIRTVRKAIRAGELSAWIPRNRNPRATGRGLGYRVNRVELMRWLFGGAATPKTKA